MAVNIMTKLHNDLLRDIGTLARTIHYLHDLHFKELALQRGQFIFLTGSAKIRVSIKTIYRSY